MHLRDLMLDAEKQLRKRGLTENDINTAIYLRHWLVLFDGLVFPKHQWCSKIQLSPKPHKDAIVAEYMRGDSKDGERYIIYVPGLYASMAKTWATTWFFPKVGRGFVLPKNIRKMKPSLEERIISIAAREVRHRMQSHKLIRPFSPKVLNQERNPLLKLLLKFAINFYRRRRDQMKKEGKSPGQIRKRVNRKEFDATIIEELILHKIRECPSPHEIANFLWAEPSASPKQKATN